MAVNWYSDKIIEKVNEIAERGLTMLANEIVKDAQQSMRETKHGIDRRKLKTITRGKNKGQTKLAKGSPSRNISSAPEEAPAVQRGRLIGSIHYRRMGRMSRLIGTNLPYGFYLEVGTRNMSPRPWLRPALYKYTGRMDFFEGKL